MTERSNSASENAPLEAETSVGGSSDWDEAPNAVRPRQRLDEEEDFNDPADEAPEIRPIPQPPEITEAPQSTPSSAIAISGYRGPMSLKAAAAFASGATVIPRQRPPVISAWSPQAKLVFILFCAFFFLLFSILALLLWAKLRSLPNELPSPIQSTSASKAAGSPESQPGAEPTGP